MTASMDPYVYPGTNVLRNLREIQDDVEFSFFEATETTARILGLRLSPISGRYDVAHLKAIHKAIFQDVFIWAGQFRTVNISKGDSMFASAPFIEPALTKLFQRLDREDGLRGLDVETFSKRAGFYLSEINAAHPFREGNGRTQREFLRELGLTAANVSIDWRRITRPQMAAASRDSFKTGNSDGMAALIRTCIDG